MGKHGIVVLLLTSSACTPSSPPREPENDPEVAGSEPVRTSDPPPSVIVTPPDTNASAEAQPTASSPTGIPVCDEYLALYARCEEYLKPEIMAGNRRFHRNEEASLVHLAGTPEAAGLPDSCQATLDALRVDCPEDQRRP